MEICKGDGADTTTGKERINVRIRGEKYRKIRDETSGKGKNRMGKY